MSAKKPLGRRENLCLLAAGVYLECGQRLLFLQRAKGEMVGFWSMPGGMVEPGERPEDAARRELQEETGISCAGSLELATVSTLHAYGHPCYRLIYFAQTDHKHVSLSDEHDAARWLTPNEYQREHLSDGEIARWAALSADSGDMVAAVRDGFTAFMAWHRRRSH